LNFGTGYGGEADILLELITKASLEHPELHIKIPTLDDCKLLLREFWKAYPEVRETRAFIHALAEDRGYSETLYGRRRNLPLISSPVWKVKAHAQRQAWSQVVQGTAGDIVKNAQLLVGREAPAFSADLRCQVHDELWGLVEFARSQEWLDRLPAMMGLDQPIHPVQLIVSPKAAETWAGAK
jgi:DNA polymerase-1